MPSTPHSHHFTRGGQLTFHALRMFFQIHRTLAKVLGGGVLLATLGLTALLASMGVGLVLFILAPWRLSRSMGKATPSGWTPPEPSSPAPPVA